jgi:hypothetical protein
MPPHLHRRAPLRQPMPPSGRVLLLPPHHPKTYCESKTAPQPPLYLPAPAPGGSLCHPILHRRGPPAHRLQRHRPAPRRPPPLRPSDRQPQPPQTAIIQAQRRRTSRRNRRRDHHRPGPRCPRSTRRSRSRHNTQKHHQPIARTHNARAAIIRSTRTRHHPHPPGHGKQCCRYFSSRAPPQKSSFRPEAAHLPPQWRNPLLYLNSPPATTRPSSQTHSPKLTALSLVS